MKKIISTFLIVLILASLVGCGGSASNKAIDEGKLAFADKEYDKALAYFEIALDKYSKDEEVNTMVQIIENYKKSLDLYEKNEIEEAEKVISNINKDYSKYSIKKDVDNLKKLIDESNTPDEKLDEEEEKDILDTEEKTLENKKIYILEF